MRRSHGIPEGLGTKTCEASAPLSCELASCSVALVVGLSFQAWRIVDPLRFSCMTEHGPVSVDGCSVPA